MAEDSSTKPRPTSQVLLGIDFGNKKSGIAIGQTLSQTAQSLKSIPTINGLPEQAALKKILNEWQPDLVIIGKPASAQTAFLKKLNKLAEHFRTEHQLSSEFIDESLTTEQANFEMHSAQLKTHKKQQQRDSIAARLILETYMFG